MPNAICPPRQPLGSEKLPESQYTSSLSQSTSDLSPYTSRGGKQGVRGLQACEGRLPPLEVYLLESEVHLLKSEVYWLKSEVDLLKRFTKPLKIGRLCRNRRMGVKNLFAFLYFSITAVIGVSVFAMWLPKIHRFLEILLYKRNSGISCCNTCSDSVVFKVLCYVLAHSMNNWFDNH